MSKQHFKRAHNLNALHEEILAARPDLNKNLRLEGMDDEVWIDAPDVDDAQIAALVAAHDETRESVNERRARVERESVLPLVGRMFDELNEVERAILFRFVLARAGMVDAGGKVIEPKRRVSAPTQETTVPRRPQRPSKLRQWFHRA